MAAIFTYSQNHRLKAWQKWASMYENWNKLLSDIVMKQEPTPLEPPTPAVPDVEALLVKARAVFADKEQERGTPEAPTQAGFLALARAGKNVWNAWRKTYPEPMPDFSKVDFRGDAAIDFSGFSFAGGGLDRQTGEFINCVNFTDCKFGDGASFNNTKFGGWATFKGVKFGDVAIFKDVKFDDGASFENSEFSEWLIFDDAQFGKWANFNSAEFGDEARFYSTRFGDSARFDDAKFSGAAIFDRAQFGDSASFDDAKFRDGANFNSAVFGDRARFYTTKFGYAAIFDGTQFGYAARFDEAEFRGAARFDGTQFGEWTKFNKAKFSDEVSFDGAQFGAKAMFDKAEFSDKASFKAWDASWVQNFWGTLEEETALQRVRYAKAYGLRSDAFRSISFLKVQFKGDVSFQGRRFLGETNFDSIFEGIPNFHGCTLYQNTSIYDAEFSAQSSEEAARAYRTLKLAFAQQHAIREEHKFFILEMRAEFVKATGLGKWLYEAYEKISFYGLSIKRPLWFWLRCLGYFGFSYGLLIGMYAWEISISEKNIHQWIQFSMLNAAPLPGFGQTLDGLRDEVFPDDPSTQLALTVLEILHKTFSLLAFFLIGLALRNLFKMKG